MAAYCNYIIVDSPSPEIRFELDKNAPTGYPKDVLSGFSVNQNRWLNSTSALTSSMSLRKSDSDRTVGMKERIKNYLNGYRLKLVLNLIPREGYFL
jgi:hypothetical protein